MSDGHPLGHRTNTVYVCVPLCCPITIWNCLPVYSFTSSSQEDLTTLWTSSFLSFRKTFLDFALFWSTHYAAPFLFKNLEPKPSNLYIETTSSPGLPPGIGFLGPISYSLFNI